MNVYGSCKIGQVTKHIYPELKMSSIVMKIKIEGSYYTGFETSQFC